MGTYRIIRLYALLFSLLLAGCVLYGLVQTAAVTYDQIGVDFVYDEAKGKGLTVIELERAPQSHPLLCGPASLAMVLGYLDSERCWADFSFPMPAEGLQTWTLGELAEYATSHGFPAFVLNSSPQELLEWINRGWPPIVSLRQPLSGFHSVVVVGYHKSEGYWVLCDPGTGFRTMSCEVFEDRWADCNQATLLIMPNET